MVIFEGRAMLIAQHRSQIAQMVAKFPPAPSNNEAVYSIMRYIEDYIWPAFTTDEKREFADEIVSRIASENKYKCLSAHWLGRGNHTFAKIAKSFAIFGRITVQKQKWYRDLDEQMMDRLDLLPGCIAPNSRQWRLGTMITSSTPNTPNTPEVPTEKRKESNSSTLKSYFAHRAKVRNITEIHGLASYIGITL